MAKGYHSSAPPRSLEEAYAQWSQIDPANIERAEYWLHTNLLPRLLELCADAVQRRNIDALTTWLHPAPEIERLYRRLGAPTAERVQRAIQIATDALRAPQPPDDPADADLYTFFRTGRWRKPTRSVRLTVALADPEEPELALALTLTLEYIPDADVPYAHPVAHWLLSWDAAFEYALNAARLGGVRWSLRPLPLCASIQGDSLGGAFALGAQLLETCPGDHQRIAILARFDPNTQRLLHVEQFQEKYDSVCAHKGVRVILISPAQSGEMPPRAVACETLPEALRLAHRHVRRQRLMRWSFAAPILPLAALLWGLQQGSYTLSLTPSGRIMIETGLVARTHIDTGYLAAELFPDKLRTGRRWRWQATSVEYDLAPYREIADALIDPLHQAKLIHALGDSARAQNLLAMDYSPFTPFRYRRLETLHALQPEQRAQWLRHAQRLPADDPASQLARVRTLHALGALDSNALIRQLKPLAQRAPEPQVRLEALELIARHDPDWVLNAPELRQIIVNASLIRSQRAYGLRVLARLSQTRLMETAPLIEPYRNDPIIQGSRDQVDLLIQMLLRRDEQFYFTERERVNDVYITDRVEAECLELVFEGLLLHFARARPTLQARWDFLLRDLRTPYAARWAVHRGALIRALITLTPPNQRPALRQYLQTQIQQPLPAHEQLAIQEALQRLQAP